MGAKIGKKSHPYSKVDVGPFMSDDEENPMLSMQIVNTEPQLLKSPEKVVEKIQPSYELFQRIETMKEEIVDTLESGYGPRVLLMDAQYSSAAVFDDLIQHLKDRAFIIQGYNPIVIINSNHAIDDVNTNNRIEKLRRSCIRAIEYGINIGIRLNSVIGVTYFTDVCSVAILENKHYTQLASITTLPVICDNASFVHAVNTTHNFYGVCGQAKPCVFSSAGNSKVYTIEKSEHVILDGERHAWCSLPLCSTHDAVQHIPPTP